MGKRRVLISILIAISFFLGFYFDIFSTLAKEAKGLVNEQHDRSVLQNWEYHYQKTLEKAQENIKAKEQEVQKIQEDIQKTRQNRQTLQETYMRYDRLMLEFMDKLVKMDANATFTFASFSYDKPKAEKQSKRWAQEIILMKEAIQTTDDIIQKMDIRAQTLRSHIEQEKLKLLDNQIKAQNLIARKRLNSSLSSEKVSTDSQLEEMEKLIQVLEKDIEKSTEQNLEAWLIPPYQPLKQTKDKDSLPTLKDVEDSLQEQQKPPVVNKEDVLLDSYRQRVQPANPAKENADKEAHQEKEK